MMSEPDQYLLGYRQAEQERLQRQAHQFAHESSWLFDQMGVTSGARVVEIGCGPSGCLRILADLVGLSGSVVGVERSDDAVTFARNLISEQGLVNVEVLKADARFTGLPRASFDFATARLVLVNVPQPEEIVAEAVALVRPGGWVAFHEADYVSHVCDPSIEAWTSIVKLLVEYSERNGIDPFVGRRLPRLLRDVGLIDIHINPIVYIYPPGHANRNILLDFADNLSERIVAQKLIGQLQLSEAKAALERHLADPSTLVVSHLFFQVWGRKAP
jgi:ubiquinone/menaquinone biosynthesis C-methylase UbiE